MARDSIPLNMEMVNKRGDNMPNSVFAIRMNPDALLSDTDPLGVQGPNCSPGRVADLSRLGF